MTKKTPAAPKKARAPKSTPAGRKILAAMAEMGDPKEFAKAIITGQVPPGAKYTIIRGVPTLPAEEVAKLRGELGLSQAAFATFLGASVQTVQAWEQGRNPVQGIAYRFLSAIRADVPYWKAKAAAG